MIRLRLDRMDYSEDPEYGTGPSRNGLIWYAYGQPVGRVIIEEYHRIVGVDGDGYEWIPVEMVDDGV